MSKKSKMILIITIMILLIIVILYLLILNFGKIKNDNSLIPTGNIDIFDIDCDCQNCTSPVFGEEDDIDKNKLNLNGLIVKDNYSIWGERELRIFSNPAFEYKSKIAPGSSNSYSFVILNNNDFDIVVDFSIFEENKHNINMKYKLKNEGKFIVGDEDTYEDISKFQLKGITIKAKEYKSYVLDWKWIDSDNDTKIGESIGAKYKLNIKIGANSK